MTADRKPPSKAEPETEAEAIQFVEAFARDLLTRYDLSKETAQLLSIETKGFQAHNLLSAKGRLKTGGGRLSGQSKLDQHISYRIGNEIVGLSILRFKKDSELIFEVLAPERCLENPKIFQQNRPYLSEVKKSRLRTHSEQFQDVKKATIAFERALMKLSPRIRKGFQTQTPESL